MTLSDILSGLDYLSDNANTGSVMMNNMIILAIELLIIFTVRGVLLLEINGIPILKTPDDKKQRKRIIENHIGHEISLAVVISWVVMILVSSAQINYVVNLIISPIVGTLGGIAIDTIYIIPKQHKSLYTTQTLDLTSESSSADHSSPSLGSPITININNQDDAPHKETFSEPSLDHLPDDISESDDFNLQIIHAINGLKDAVHADSQSMELIQSKFIELLSQLDKLKESERIEKHILLKSQIYKSLAAGFVTPEEHDKIRAEYHIYKHLLGGNGDIQDLYENHFNQLGVHEDRRKSDKPYEGQNRRTNNNCSYGQFDNTNNTSK